MSVIFYLKLCEELPKAGVDAIDVFTEAYMAGHVERRTQSRPPERERLLLPQRLSQIWSADFISDALYYDLRFRPLNVIDDLQPRVAGYRRD